jgi:hypothetical protein
MDWDAISKSYEMVAAELVSRVDGVGWKVYRVGQLIRIDIEGKN